MKKYNDVSFERRYVVAYDNEDREQGTFDTIEEAVAAACETTRFYKEGAIVGYYKPEDIEYLKDPDDPESWDGDFPECYVDGYRTDETSVGIYSGHTYEDILRSYLYNCGRFYGDPIVVDGVSYQLTRDPELGNRRSEAVYSAEAVREDAHIDQETGTVDTVTVYWDILPEWDGEDEADACVWEKPSDIEASSNFVRLRDEFRR